MPNGVVREEHWVRSPQRAPPVAYPTGRQGAWKHLAKVRILRRAVAVRGHPDADAKACKPRAGTRHDTTALRCDGYECISGSAVVRRLGLLQQGGDEHQLSRCLARRWRYRIYTACFASNGRSIYPSALSNLTKRSFQRRRIEECDASESAMRGERNSRDPRCVIRAVTRNCRLKLTTRIERDDCIWVTEVMV